MADGHGREQRDGSTTTHSITSLDMWARVIDYLFGRNALIGLASFMLLVISGYATWSGMNDFIIGAASGASKGRDLPGGFSVSHTNLVIAVTIALTFLMWIALRESIGAQRRAIERLVTIPLYLFLVLWSVGFGYGFWWSLIAGEEATRSSLAALQEDARDSSQAIAARLDAVRAQIDSVAAWSDSQMTREEASGGSCGVPSGAGRGPLYNARRSVRDGVSSLRDNVNRSWLAPVQADLEILRKNASAIEGDSAEDRQKRFEQIATQIRGAAKNIAARSNELGQSTATEMRALAAAVSVPPGQAGFTCHDPTLAQRLSQAATQASEPASIKLRNVVYSEGPAGVANAVKNLWTNLGAYAKGLFVWAFSGGKHTIDHTAQGEPITGRDMIALLATIGIDLGLFVLALLDPPAAGPIRRDGLARSQASLHLPSGTVIRQLAAAFETAIARAPDANLEWVRQHFIHHEGASYFIIPNLYSVDRSQTEAGRKEELRALAINQLAGVLDDVKLIRALTPGELRGFLREEDRYSYSDLTQIQKRGRPSTPTGWLGGRWRHTAPVGDQDYDKGRVRNHALLSKAQRALGIAGWSQAAQRDVEIFRLVDTEGLTPLLTLLNEATLHKGAESAAAASDEAARTRQALLPPPRAAATPVEDKPLDGKPMA
jgi:hypothetical protein